MVRPQRPLRDRERPLVQGLGLGVAVLAGVVRAQKIEPDANLKVVYP